jgi:hypothetical protein
MPCNSWGSGPEPLTVYVEKGVQTARLCAVFKVLESKGILGEVMHVVDWKEAGVDRMKTLQWWEKHKEEDRQRLIREQKQRETARQKKAILNKLSAKEKKILGVE